MPGCKPGDLAIVIGSLDAGKIVKVIRWVEAEEATKIIEHILGEEFFVKNGGWLIDTDLLLFRVPGFEQYKVPLCKDEFLVPLRGDLLSEEEKQECEVVA